MNIDMELLRKLPKTDLHCHLDGSMRVSTILDIAKKNSVELPTTDEEELKKIVQMDENCKSLVDYLTAFGVTTKVMQDYDSLKRIAFELTEDAASENIRYLEVRYAPCLHQERGLKLTQIVDAVVDGLKEGERQFNIKTGVIICGLRHLNPTIALELADLTIAFKNRGVVAFDLAGAEADYPAKDFKEAFSRTINNLINSTVHAGEAFGPDSISQAIRYCGAHRIGHGTRLIEDGDLLHYVNDHRIALEICLTSNVQTCAVESFKTHPLKMYYDLGLRITLNTDNRLVSNTDMTTELFRAAKTFNMSISDIANIILNGFKSAFVPYGDKTKLIRNAIKELDNLVGSRKNEYHY